MHGTADADVPVADARQIDALVPNHKLVVLDGADHCFSDDDGGAFFRLAGAVLPFIAERSGGGPDGGSGPDGGQRRGVFWLGR